jgi:hypothetical protein
MEYDQAKIDEMVLALLGAGEFERGRVWKRIDFGAMERLHEKGYITDPRGKQVDPRHAGLEAWRIAVRHTGADAARIRGSDCGFAIVPLVSCLQFLETDEGRRAMSKYSEHMTEVVRETVRLYFAPLVGAVRGIRQEYRQIEAETNARRMRAAADRHPASS